MSFQFALAKQVVLRAAYEYLVYKAEFEQFEFSEVHKQVADHISSGFVQRILSVLVKDGLIEQDQYDEFSSILYTVSDEGIAEAEKLPALPYILKRDSEFVQEDPLAPTSDGLVPLNHNQTGYSEIAEGLELAIEEAQATKPNDVSGDEHASILNGLVAARELWKAYQLKTVQVRVGILMALEDAQNALKRTFRVVKGPLLVDAIKAFFAAAKDGIDL